MMETRQPMTAMEHLHQPDRTASEVDRPSRHRLAAVEAHPPHPERPVRASVHWLVVLVAGIALIAGCAAPQQARPRVPHGLLIIEGLPEDTVVRLDDAPFGTLADHPAGLALPSGERRLELRPPDGLIWRVEVSIEADTVSQWSLDHWPRIDQLDDEEATEVLPPPAQRSTERPGPR